MIIRKGLLGLLWFLMFSSLCLCHASIEQQKEAEWFPFVITEKLDLGSLANMGNLILDPPAGKHGFVKTKNKYFYFEDGTRAKFWGTNFCFNACFPTKEEAEIIADRVAFFGFNAVRFHHMDYYFEPKGIFKDTHTYSNDSQMKKTSELSEKQLDRLDYFIYQLKKRGIYINMNLLVSRHFTKADGIIDADRLGMAAKPVSMFDPNLIELEKRYAKDLLTHYNPYTKLRYCDDPAIALIEITNEDSIIEFWKREKLNKWSPYSLENPIPEYYIKELDTMWNNWLKEKYGISKKSHRPLYNSLMLYSAKTRKDIKEFYVDLEKKYFKQMIKFLKIECNAKVPITGIGGYRQPEDIGTQEDCDFIDKHTYWDHPSFPNKMWDKNNFKIHNKSMLLDKNLGIAGIGIKSNPKNNKPYTITEWNHCYPNQYAYETPVFFASTAYKNNWDALFQFAFSHGWKTKPEFDYIRNYFDSIANSQKLILCSVASLVFHETNNLKISIKNGIFKLDSPSIKGTAGFIKNKVISFDYFTIKSKSNGAVFLYSALNKPINKSDKLILVVIGEIKNNGGSWENGNFVWGERPILIKKMDVEITLNSYKKFKVFELNSMGKINKDCQLNHLFIFSTKNCISPWFEILFN